MNAREDVVVATPDDSTERPDDDAAGAAPNPLMGPVARRRIRYGLRTWFRTPPRRHGEVIDSREVSFLELFYDLVFVVLIGRTTHHLAADVSGRSIVEFAVVFGLIWLAWFNGTLWHELHGREDGRSRNYIFLQMGLLALLAVFAGEAAGDDGQGFAIVYTVLFTLLTWQWWQVHRVDTDRRYRPTTIRYLIGMVTTTGVVLVSAFVGNSWRLVLWGAVVIGWVIGSYLLASTDHTEGFGEGVTASLVERMGLFTIIVLGELVVGVVGGISDAEDRDVMTVAAGLLGLTIAMGIWWNYFDMLGRRVPGQRGHRLASWLLAHLPLAMAIAASGAAMVSIIEHAHDSRTPGPTAWLLTCSVAVTLGAVSIACTALPVDEFPAGMQRLVGPTAAIAAGVAITIGAFRPAPIVLLASISAVLLLVWLAMFAVYLALGGDPDVENFQLGHDQGSRTN